MNTDKTPASSTEKAIGTNNDASKLVSLLALAAGAAVMPQTSNADIIFMDGGGSTVNWEGMQNFVTGNLPGDVQLGFTAKKSGSFSFNSVRYITGGKRGAGYLQFKLLLVTQPLLWNDIPGLQKSNATFASAGSSFFNMNPFNGAYLAFEFKDSTQAGSPMRYGWAQLSLQNGNLSTGNDFPKLTINGWAYDNTGNQIAMGAVPEPSSTTLLALGALALGAKGLRSWRRNRGAAS